jgi:hypothetical protein
MSKKVISVAALTALLWAAGSETCLAWNDTARRLFIAKAIDALPKPLKGFYDDNKVGIAEAISDPSRFGQRAVFEIDKLEPFPFDDLPSDRTLAERKYGEDKLKEVGDAPWRIVESYKALVEAFKSGDFKKALTVSEDLAYLVGELYDPPNVSKSGDGEPTGQLGLRERFDSRLMEAFGDKLKLSTPTAIFLDRPAEYAASIPLKSYIFVDNILYFDYLSHKGVESYDRFYYESMWLRAEPVLQQLLSSAALDSASFWYTAWMEAKKPDLPKK